MAAQVNEVEGGVHLGAGQGHDTTDAIHEGLLVGLQELEDHPELVHGAPTGPAGLLPPHRSLRMAPEAHSAQRVPTSGLRQAELQAEAGAAVSLNLLSQVLAGRVQLDQSRGCSSLPSPAPPLLSFSLSPSFLPERLGVVRHHSALRTVAGTQ